MQKYVSIIPCSIFQPPSQECKTKTGVPCDVPFLYEKMYYDTCINVDNGGVSWCYTNGTNKDWGVCNLTSCPNAHSKYLMFPLWGKNSTL